MTGPGTDKRRYVARPRPARAPPSAARLAGRRPGAAPRPADRELRVRRDADGLRDAVPAAPAVDLATSRDPLLYAPIAAAAPAVRTARTGRPLGLPDQPGCTREEFTFALVNGILGRLYLSGHLDRMTPAELDLVRSALAAHRTVLRASATTRPLLAAGPARPGATSGSPSGWRDHRRRTSRCGTALPSRHRSTCLCVVARSRANSRLGPTAGPTTGRATP